MIHLLQKELNGVSGDMGWGRWVEEAGQSAEAEGKNERSRVTCFLHVSTWIDLKNRILS